MVYVGWSLLDILKRVSEKITDCANKKRNKSTTGFSLLYVFSFVLGVVTCSSRYNR